MGNQFCIKTETGLQPLTELQRGLVKPELLVPCGEDKKPPDAPKDSYTTKDSGRIGDRFCIETNTGLRWVAESDRALVKPEAFVPCAEGVGPPVEPKNVSYKDFDFNLNGQVNFGYAPLTQGQYGGVPIFGCFGPIEPMETLNLEHLKSVDDPAKLPKALDQTVGKK